MHKKILDKVNKLADTGGIERPALLFQNYVDEFRQVKQNIDEGFPETAKMILDELIREFEEIKEVFK